eukprot:1160564-Pelagomonas_calceolata.AAC.6
MDCRTTDRYGRTHYRLRSLNTNVSQTWTNVPQKEYEHPCITGMDQCMTGRGGIAGQACIICITGQDSSWPLWLGAICSPSKKGTKTQKRWPYCRNACTLRVSCNASARPLSCTRSLSGRAHPLPGTRHPLPCTRSHPLPCTRSLSGRAHARPCTG